MTHRPHHQEPPHDPPRDDGARRFPSEAEWLDLPAPDMAPDSAFVERTLRAVLQDRGQEYIDEDPARLPPLAPGFLAAFAPPPPSADFAARTLQQIECEQSERLRNLLRRYVTPEPSPDFVQRTLLALRQQPRPVIRWFRARRVLALAAAAALLLWLLPWPRSSHESLQTREIRAGAGLNASTWSASPWALARRHLRAEANATSLPLAAADGLLLVADAHGGHR